MKTKINGIDVEGDFHPSCIRLTEKAIEAINELQAGGTDLEKNHTDDDFDDCGIDDRIRIMNEISDFIFSIYRWKMDKMEGDSKSNFAFEVLHNLNQIDYIKDLFNSLRAKPEFDEFFRQPKTK